MIEMIRRKLALSDTKRVLHYIVCARHTFCSRLCEQDINVKVIQVVMGHKDIQTTLDIYAEVTEGKKHEVFETLANNVSVF